MRIKRFILLIAIVAVVVLLYKFPFKHSEQPGVNTTNPITLNPDNPDLTGFGDLLIINYVLKAKKTGEVFDTNNPELAEKYNIKNYIKGPYTFILGNSDKLKKKSFDKALVGWKDGEKKSVEIAPTEKELYIKVERNKQGNLYFSIPRYQALPLKNFKEVFGKEPEIDDTVSNPKFPWSFKIINMTENNAVGDPIIKKGEKYVLSKEPWPVEVSEVFDMIIQFKHAPEKDIYDTDFGPANVSVSENKISIQYNPEQDKILDYFYSAGAIKIPGKFKIVEIKEDEFVLHRLDNVNDKWLILEAEILERMPDVKSVKNESILDKAKITETIQ